MEKLFLVIVFAIVSTFSNARADQAEKLSDQSPLIQAVSEKNYVLAKELLSNEGLDLFARNSDIRCRTQSIRALGREANLILVYVC